MSAADVGAPGIGTIWSLGSGLARWLNRGGGLSEGERAAIAAANAAGYSRRPFRGRAAYFDPQGRITTERNVIRAGRAILSAADAPRPVMGQPTPPYKSPTLIAAERVLTESRKAPKKTRKRLRRSARREQWEKWIAIGRKQLPKGAGKKVGAIIRKLPKVPGAVGGILGPTIAWNVGQWIGTEIYERGSAWYYGQGKRPKLPKPQPAPREHPHPPVTPRPVQSAGRPAAPRQTARPGVPTPRAATTPKLEEIKVTAQRVSVPVASPATPAATATATRAAQLKRAVAIASAAYALMPARAKRKRGARSDTGLSTVGYVAPLTAFQTESLPYRDRVVPKVKTKTCECEKPRKRSGRKACRNPIIRKRKQTRNGRTLITTTRELRCPQ